MANWILHGTIILLVIVLDVGAFSTAGSAVAAQRNMMEAPSITASAPAHQLVSRLVSPMFRSFSSVTVLQTSIPHEETESFDDSGDDTTSVSSDEVHHDEDNMAQKVAGRKQRVKYGYKAMMLGHAALAVLTISRFGIRPMYLHAASSGALTACVMSFLLLKAAQANRLASDTYKRMNLALVAYGMMGVASVGLDPRLYTVFGILATITVFITTINCIKGYGYGVKGWELQGGMAVIGSDIKKALSNTLQIATTLQPNKPLSWGLGASFITAGTLCLIQLFRVGQSVVQRDPLVTLANLSGSAKFWLTSCTALTLKDAADRGRLEGTTFIQLNMIQTLVLGTFAARMAAAKGSIYPPPFLAVLSFFYASLSAFGAMRSIARKKSTN